MKPFRLGRFLVLALSFASTLALAPASAAATDLPRELQDVPCRWKGLRIPVTPGEAGYICRDGIKILMTQSAWVRGECRVRVRSGQLEIPDVVLRTDATGASSITVGASLVSPASFSTRGVNVQYPPGTSRKAKDAVTLTTSYESGSGAWTLVVVGGFPVRGTLGTCTTGRYIQD